MSEAQGEAPGEAVLPISSALAEADPTNITETFSKDPETWVDGDIRTMTLKFRAMRQKFLKAEAEAKLKPKKGVPKANPEAFKVGDLGL